MTIDADAVLQLGSLRWVGKRLADTAATPMVERLRRMFRSPIVRWLGQNGVNLEISADCKVTAETHSIPLVLNAQSVVSFLRRSKRYYGMAAGCLTPHSVTEIFQDT